MTLQEAFEFYNDRKYDLAFPTLKEYAERGESDAQWRVGCMYEKGKGVEQDCTKAIEWYTMVAEQGDRDAQWRLGYKYELGKGTKQDSAKAAEWYTKSAELGHSLAQWRLGYMYEEGKGIEQNYVNAIEWYTKAAEQGDKDAQIRLGRMYEEGKGVEQDFAKAVVWYTKSAEQGDCDAQIALGDMYKNGKGVVRDSVKAVKWYAKAAEQGDDDAQWHLGYMYEEGKGVEQDYVKAIELYKKSAERGNNNAQMRLEILCDSDKSIKRGNAKLMDLYARAAKYGSRSSQLFLGYMYETGRDVEQDYVKAAEWYTKAAEQGDASAQRRLGNLYKEGNGVAQDYVKAAEWYAKAAEQCDSDAQFDLGQMYDFGCGVEQDYAKAVEWYTKSEEQGNSDAQLRLGILREFDNDVKQDCVKSAEQYKESAEQGHPLAQSRLGNLYEFGKGVKQDYVKAVEWYAKAAEQGCVSAQEQLGYLYKNGKGVEQDLNKAAKLYAKAAESYAKLAEQGNGDAQWHLGILYKSGNGVEKNYTNAIKWFKRAAAQGNNKALSYLGQILGYDFGDDVEHGFAEIKELYAQAANYAELARQWVLAMSYLENDDEQSREIAIEMLNQLIEQNYLPAQLALGFFYKKRNDYVKALKCFESAFANGGGGILAIVVGDFYKCGLGVKQNGEKAKEYYLQADEADSSYSLGNLYLQGCEGIEQDVETAYEYFKKAKEKGIDCGLSIEMCEKYLGIAKDDSHGIREFADKIDVIDSGTYDIVDNELRSDFGDIWDSLQDETKADLRTGLLEYTILYKLYRDKDVDFSAAISPITKAFEIVLARFFCRDFVKFLEDNNVNPSLYRRYPFLVDRETGKFHADTDSFTLGSFCNLIAGDKLLRQMERQQPVIKDAMRKGEIKYVSFDKNITSSVDKNVIAYVENILFKDAMTGATENYLLGLAQEVSFVSDIYRNPAMHKKKMGLAVAESCGDCLIKVKKIIYHFVEHIDFEKIKQESYKIKYDVDLFRGNKKVDVNKPALQVGDVIDLQITDVDDRHLGKFDKDGNTYNVVLQYRR